MTWTKIIQMRVDQWWTKRKITEQQIMDYFKVNNILINILIKASFYHLFYIFDHRNANVVLTTTLDACNKQTLTDLLDNFYE